jgi:hypothetical protein
VLANPNLNIREELAKLIDFGRVVGVADRMLQGIPAGDIPDIITLYDTVSGSVYETDRARVTAYNIGDLFIVASGRGTNETRVIDTMEDILKFIANLDYAVNCILYDFASISWDKPQISGMLIHLYGEPFNTYWGTESTRTTRWIHGTHPPEWRRTADTIAKYREIADFIRRIATPPQSDRNLVSVDAIQRMVQDGEIYSLNPGNDYDRSRVVLTPPPAQVQAMGRPQAQVIGPSNYNPHATYMPQRAYVQSNDSDDDMSIDDDDASFPNMSNQQNRRYGGRVKKTRKSRKSKKSEKSEKSRKSRKSRKIRR